MTLSDLLGGDPQQHSFERLRSQWDSSYDVWRNLPLSQVLSAAPRKPASLKEREGLERAVIGYTVCTKTASPLMCVEIIEFTGPLAVSEKLDALKEAQLPTYVVLLPRAGDPTGTLRRPIVDHLVSLVLAHWDAEREYEEYNDQQQQIVNFVALEMFGEGSSPYINDWYAGEEVDSELKYNPVGYELRQVQREFANLDRRYCTWGSGDSSCSAKALSPRSELVLSSPSPVGAAHTMLSRRVRINTHVGMADSAPVWVSEFDKAEGVASSVASIIATRRALAMLRASLMSG